MAPDQGRPVDALQGAADPVGVVRLSGTMGIPQSSTRNAKVRGDGKSTDPTIKTGSEPQPL